MLGASDLTLTAAVLGISILFAAVAWLTCVTWYSITAKWWHNAYGINTWMVSFTITVALTRLAVLVLAPDFLSPLVSSWIGISTYVLLAIAGFQRLYLIDKAQREGENNYHRRVTDKM